MAGTVLVKDLGDDPAARINPWEQAIVGGRLFFLVWLGHAGGGQIWASDGTDAGTAPAIDLGDGMVLGLGALGSDLLFFHDDGIHGVEPWKSDGTTPGSSLLGDVATGSGSSYLWDYHAQFLLHNSVTLGGAVLMRLFDAGGDVELWRLDLTSGATQVAEINAQSQGFEIGSFGFSRSPRPLGALGNDLVFQASDGVRGFELWRSDGTPAGTSFLAELEPGPQNGYPAELTPLGGGLVFRAGPEPSLWRTDGTPAGTQELGASFSVRLLRAGTRVFFLGAGASGGGPEALWQSDGTAAGTSPVTGTPTCSAWPAGQLGSRLAFVGSDCSAFRLWITDGSPGGTTQVSSSPRIDFLSRLAATQDLLFFAGSDAAGEELWVSDGATAQRAVDLRPGPASSFKPWTFIDFDHFFPEKIAPLGPRAVFLADDGTTGEEPWISDGTEQGTLLLADAMPGLVSSDPDQLVSTVPRVYFVADDGIHGRELWSTDGSVDGTRMVLDIVAGPGSSVPRHLTAIDGLLLFTAWDPFHGAEAWISDGTPEGTYRLGDVAPGAASASPVHFTAAGDLVYFTANDNVTGFELWAIGRTELRTTPTDFFTVPPCRVFDSRSTAPLEGSSRRISITGLCGIPTTARAVAANVTVVGGTSPGRIQMAGALAPQTGQVLVPFGAGRARAQQTMLRLGFGALDARAAFDLGPGSVDVIIDVTGYFE